MILVLIVMAAIVALGVLFYLVAHKYEVEHQEHCDPEFWKVQHEEALKRAMSNVID